MSLWWSIRETSRLLPSSESPPGWKFAALYDHSASRTTSVPSSTHYQIHSYSWDALLCNPRHAHTIIGHDVNGSGWTLRPCELIIAFFTSVAIHPCCAHYCLCIYFIRVKFQLVVFWVSVQGEPQVVLEAFPASCWWGIVSLWKQCKSTILKWQPFLTNLLSFVITYLKKHSKEPSSESLLVSLIDLIEKSTIMDIGKKMVSPIYVQILIVLTCWFCLQGLLSQLGELPSSVLVSILCKHTLDGRPYWEQLQRMILTYLAALYPADEHRRFAWMKFRQPPHEAIVQYSACLLQRIRGTKHSFR